MRKIIWVVLLVFAVALTVYIISSAQNKASQTGRPEDTKGKSASSYQEIVDEDQDEQGKSDKPKPKGSENMKVTGPVWVEE